MNIFCGYLLNDVIMHVLWKFHITRLTFLKVKLKTSVRYCVIMKIFKCLNAYLQ